jgi:peptidyl-prolyl cis-trans isomerase C
MFVIFLGCSRRREDVDYIARVDDEYLLKSELKGIDSNLVAEYIQTWIRNNLLYLEARERGYDNDEDVERLVNEFKKSLVIKNFLMREIYDRSDNVTSEEMQDYYSQHRDEFVLDEPVYRMGYVKLRTLQSANDLRRAIIRRGSFRDGINSFIEERSEEIVEMVLDKYFHRLEVPSSRVWKVASNLSKGEISFPVRVGRDYYLVFVYDKKKAGDIADFEYVKDEIRSRIIIERRNRMMDSLITELKRKYLYEIKWRD